MGLKAEAEAVSDKAAAIARIIARSQQIQIVPDSAAAKKWWLEEIKELQDHIKKIVGGW